MYAIPGKKTKTKPTDNLEVKISTTSPSVGPKVPLGEFVLNVFIVRGSFPQLCSAVFVIHLTQETEIGDSPHPTHSLTHPPLLVLSQPVGLGSIWLLEKPSMAKTAASYMHPIAGGKIE